MLKLTLQIGKLEKLMCNLEHFGEHYIMMVSLRNIEELLTTKVPNCLQKYSLIFKKTDVRLDYTQTFSVKFTDDGVYLHYTHQPINAI
jgi:hypothetical protein